MTGATTIPVPHLAPLAFAMLFSVFSLGADAPPTAGPTVPSDPIFSALMADGTVASGRIRQISPNGDLTLVPSRGAEQVLACRRLVKLSRDGFLSMNAPEKQLVLLPEGDRLYRAVVGAASETKLDVQSLTFGKVAIPLESLAGLVFDPPVDEDASFELVNRVRTEPQRSEILWLAPNGDRVQGGFLGLDEKALKFQASTGPISLELAKVVALGFDASLVSYPKPAGPFFELTASDGSRLGVTNPKIVQGEVIATTRFGAPVRLALNDLVHLHTRSDSIVYLTEREVAEARYVGYVGPTRPFRRNSSVDGHPLRLAGQTYDRGLGTQSRTILAYRLAPGDRRFQALVGLDDRAGPLGSVVFRVLVDAQERFISSPISARDTPKAIDIDVQGAKLLILITEFGERGEVRDFADWVEARLLR
ncbi:NPCBM/NEW2 domain-containing protein [Singulisphaera acidiphila]|uniref:Putative carbohydrate binding protein n=1 Tax=Singulisphaera acidiphila (strain ATCC BAA-1392 / DSM 18658 / VKM B-2454 / MOB10) TaxID=886293 RepID=L0DBJ3_SINAD|nr:NPCBM/NEW2 domain-containing protein [Singulisphaera acidiphila]AGA26208.1 putative carbohydrate binding protein [Singulisphaera acidiphila DSM 18658]